MSGAKIMTTCIAAIALTACKRDQSALAPNSDAASSIFTVTYVLLVGGCAVLFVVVVLAGAALAAPASVRRYLAQEKSIVLGGIVFPFVTLTPLLVYGYAELDGSAERGRERAVEVTVIGERWWWRVVYTVPGGGSFETANELHIPVGQPVRLKLESTNVIHSFWVPSLAGKVDMIPGRTNQLTFTARQEGEFRGQCAEYCGGAHAFMAFKVIAEPKADFERWLQRASGPSTQPASDVQRKGQKLFLANGCGGCHTIRGTEARGRIGPDLTHLARRSTLAAVRLPNTRDNLVTWIRDNQQIKPENLMLPYRHLSLTELHAIAEYLASLD